MLKRTPLYAAHQKLGARLVEFGGWEMPVQYSSITDEHLAVRKSAGLFDISHMGEVRVSGLGAADFLNHLLTNDIRKLAVGGGQYTLMCNTNGGVIDDLYAYRLDETNYLLIINASRIEEDVKWMQEQLEPWPNREATKLINESEKWGAIALQGPRAVEFIDTCFPGASTSGTRAAKASELKKNQVGAFSFHSKTIYVARTGYTGEDGFEIIAPTDTIESVWSHVLAIGHAHCLQPAGLGARDTLRTEVCYPLYGHELDEKTTPIQAGLGFFVALDKPEFIGKARLAEQKASGFAKKCIAFKMTEKAAPPRPHYPIWSTGPNPSILGEVVSGTQSPSLQAGIGLGYVPPEFAKPGTAIEIEVRGKKYGAQVVQKPIFRKEPKP